MADWVAGKSFAAVMGSPKLCGHFGIEALKPAHGGRSRYPPRVDLTGPSGRDGKLLQGQVLDSGSIQGQDEASDSGS